MTTGNLIKPVIFKDSIFDKTLMLTLRSQNCRHFCFRSNVWALKILDMGGVVQILFRTSERGVRKVL